MDLAAKVLIIGGLTHFVYGCLNGFGFAKQRNTREYANRYLVMTHTGSFLFGAVLMALVVALPLLKLPDNVGLAAAVLVVVGAWMVTVKNTLDWLANVTDEFKQKPIVPRILGPIGVLCDTVGYTIFLVGAIRGL
ncbi:MAG TPA: hypothetical protein VF678_09785 [bacterium]